jgi:hypothetical protein
MVFYEEEEKRRKKKKEEGVFSRFVSYCYELRCKRKVIREFGG